MNSKTEKSKTKKRTTTRPFVYVAITLSLAIGECFGKLVQTPTNTTVYVGSRATLQCQTDQPLTVFWYFNDKEIFYGGRISLEYSSKFDIETRSTSDGNYYNLVIPSADTWYNGRYMCGDDEGQGEKQSAWVTVTDSPTTVESVPLPITVASTQTISIGVTVGIIAAVIGLALGIVILVYCLLKRRGKTENVQLSSGDQFNPSKVDEEKALPDQQNNGNKYEVGENQNKNVITDSNPPAKATIKALNANAASTNQTNQHLSPTNPNKPKNLKLEKMPISEEGEYETIEMNISRFSAKSVNAAGNDPPPQEPAESTINSKHTEDKAMRDEDIPKSGLLQNETTEQNCGAEEDINGEEKATIDEKALLLPANIPVISNKDN